MEKLITEIGLSVKEKGGELASSLLRGAASPRSQPLSGTLETAVSLN